MARRAYHLSEPSGAGPVTLNLNNDRITLDGTLNFGDPITINAAGTDSIDASAGFTAVEGSINLAANAHLVTTGTIAFASGASAYEGDVTGGSGSLLTNNGLLNLGSGHLSAAVNGRGTLEFVGYHQGRGNAVISSSIGYGQTVDLVTGNSGLTMTLADVADFHGLIKMEPSAIGTSITLVLNGLQADGFTVGANSVTLTEAGKAVETLRVANAGSVPIAATYGIPTALSSTTTQLLFHSNPIVT